MAQSLKITNTCLNCGVRFSLYPSWLKQRNGAPFCSIKCRANASKGIPTNVGHSVSEKMRAKLRTARLKQVDPRLGKKHSDESRLKMSIARKGRFGGDKCPTWKGGITTKNRLERDRFRRELQKKILARDNWICQICFIHANKLHVDHIKRWADYPELRFEMDNCRTLCVPCHYYITFKKSIPEGLVWAPTTKEQMRSI